MAPNHVLSETELGAGLQEALQETNHHRELDSLETIIVRTWLTSQQIECDSANMPEENTIAGWIAWVKSFESH